MVEHTRNSIHHFSLEIWGMGGGGGRLKVYFESHLKLDLFSKSDLHFERENFAASFYNKNSILIYFFKIIDF